MKDMRYLRRHGLKTKIKKKAAIDPRKGISQANLKLVLISNILSRTQDPS